MNYVVSVGELQQPLGFGSVIYNDNSIRIESDFNTVMTYKNKTGAFFCLGNVRSKDKNSSVEACLENVDIDSFQSVINKLQGRFVLFFIVFLWGYL